MKNLFTVLTVVFFLACLTTTAIGQEDKKVATLAGSGLNVRFDVAASYSEATLTISSPDGQVFRREFRSGSTPEFTLTDKRGDRLPDGTYTYELRLAPHVSAAVREKMTEARKKGNEDELQRELRKRGELPQGSVQSGNFMVLNGSVIVAGATEPGAGDKIGASQPSPAFRPRPSRLRPAGLSGLRNHMSLLPFFDFVIADDLIVQGSACVGLDCVDGENFGFDTIRVKENNTRIQYDDTSTSAGFATNNWQIRANDQGSGGGSFLGFVDQGSTGNSETGTIVFRVDAGAIANALRVSSGSNVGIGTATPVLDVHANTSDTPAIRLEQNNSGGFTAQTWDIGANEANFFVRDVTSGSRLPFRIRPGAPTSSIDILADGDVGVGTASATFSGNTAKFVAIEAPSGEFSEVGSGSNQSGTTSVLGTFSFFNTNRATAEKRNAVITGQNDGATTSGAMVFFTSNAGTLSERMRIGSNGRVGIGTSAADQLLSVNGDASKTGGNTWLAFSDERLKNIKGRYTLGLKAVMQLQPIRYEYKHDNALGLKSESEHIGLGAQAVQKVIPDAVTKNEQGYLLVNGDPIIWTMLNAIKEQQKQIEDLKREVRQLRAARRRK